MNTRNNSFKNTLILHHITCMVKRCFLQNQSQNSCSWARSCKYYTNIGSGSWPEYVSENITLPYWSKKEPIHSLGCNNTSHFEKVAQDSFAAMVSGSFTCPTTHKMLNKKYQTASRLAPNHTGRMQQPRNLLCLACRLSNSKQSFIYCTIIFSVKKCCAAHFKKLCCNDCVVLWRKKVHLQFHSVYRSAREQNH